MQTVLQALGNNLFHVEYDGSNYARVNAPDNSDQANVHSLPGSNYWARAVAGFVLGSAIPKNHKIVSASLQFDHGIAIDSTTVHWFKSDYSPDESSPDSIYQGIGATHTSEITDAWDSYVAGPVAVALTNAGLVLLEEAIASTGDYFPLGCKVANDSAEREGSIFASGLKLVVTHYPLA